MRGCDGRGERRKEDVKEVLFGSIEGRKRKKLLCEERGEGKKESQEENKSEMKERKKEKKSDVKEGRIEEKKEGSGERKKDRRNEGYKGVAHQAGIRFTGDE